MEVSRSSDHSGYDIGDKATTDRTWVSLGKLSSMMMLATHNSHSAFWTIVNSIDDLIDVISFCIDRTYMNATNCPSSPSIKPWQLRSTGPRSNPPSRPTIEPKAQHQRRHHTEPRDKKVTSARRPPSVQEENASKPQIKPSRPTGVRHIPTVPINSKHPKALERTCPGNINNPHRPERIERCRAGMSGPGRHKGPW